MDMEETREEEIEESTKLISRAKSIKEKWQPNWNRRDMSLLVLVVLAQGGSVCSDSFLYPFFPEEALRRGLTQTYIGVVFSSYEMARFVTSPIAGSLVAKTTPKTMSIIGGALASLSCVLLGLFYYVDDRLFFPCNVVARLLGGSGMSMLAVSGLSLLFKATNYKAGTILSVVEGTIGGAYILGPATGIVFKQIGGYAGACYIFGIFIGVLVLLQIFMLPNIEDTIKSSKSYFHLVKVPGLVLMFIYCFVNTFGMSSRLVTIPTFIMLTFGVTSSDIGVILCISNTVYMLSSPFIGWMMNQGYIYSIMIGGWISQFFLLLFIGPSPLLDYIFHGQKYFLSCAILWCSLQVSQAVAFLAPFKASLNLAEATGYERNSLHTYGMIAGMINCAQGLGSIVGPVGGGAIYEALGFPWMMTIIGFIQLGVVALMIVFLLGMRATNQPLTSRELTNQSE